MAPVGARHLAPPLDTDDSAGVGKVVRKEPGEHERPTVVLGLGHEPGGVHERRERVVGDCVPVEQERRDGDVVHRTLTVTRIRPVRFVAHPERAATEFHKGVGMPAVHRGRGPLNTAPTGGRRATGTAHGRHRGRVGRRRTDRDSKFMPLQWI